MIVDLSLDPAILHLGPVGITWPGLGAALALAAIVWQHGRRGGTGGTGPAAGRCVVAAALAGVLAARCVQVATTIGYYQARPWEALRLWDGATAPAVALLGASLGASWAARRRVTHESRALDRSAPLLIGGFACTQFGAFLAGSSWGRPTRGDWGVIYWHPRALVPPELLGAPLHPYPLYHVCLASLLLVLVLIARRATDAPGLAWRASNGGIALFAAGLAPFAPVGHADAQLVIAALFALAALVAPRAHPEGRGRDRAPLLPRLAGRRQRAACVAALGMGLGIFAAPVPESPGRWEPHAARAVALEGAWIVAYATAEPRTGDRICTGLYLALAEGEGRWAASFLERQARALARADPALAPPGVTALLLHYRALVGEGAQHDTEATLRRLLDDTTGPALRRQAAAELARPMPSGHAPVDDGALPQAARPVP